MPDDSYIDSVKTTVTMEQILTHYGFRDHFSRDGNRLIGPCPLHRKSTGTEFHVNMSNNVWNCSGDCKHGGNVLDFVAILENITLDAAAIRIAEWFTLTPITR